MKIKDLGQVFTPQNIVKDVLDTAGYNGEDILNKHIIDNSCGDGAFLLEIINRYINEYKKKNKTIKGIEEDLKKYIHGIELDKEIYEECINNINNYLKEFNIKDINLDILNKDTLKVKKYNNKMDYVVGNPPYVRVHNLNKLYKEVKKYNFCETGMTDLYIVFYEIGLKMLNKNGVLCYITPNSFYNSLAGKKLREYIKKNQTLESIMDLGHYQPFVVSTYTTICKFINNKKFNECKYFKYDFDGTYKYIADIYYEDLFIDNNIVLSNDNEKILQILNYQISKNEKAKVKNGFATLNDKIFIQKEFLFKNNVIDVIKASTGEWKKCIFPYDNNGKLIDFDMLDNAVKKHFNKYKKELIKQESKKDSSWYAFGRSQAINDVKYNKISINTTIKNVESIKLNKVKKGSGVYSGLYILTSEPFLKIKSIICNEDFINYIKVINKCKSGGYYTFSSKDLAKYINYYLEVQENE